MSTIDTLISSIDEQLATARTEMQRLQTARDILTDSPRASVTKITGRPRPNRARRGQRLQQTLEAIRANPGIKPGEIGPAIGAESTYGYKAVSRLRNEGTIEREGDGWKLVEQPEQPQSEQPEPEQSAQQTA